MGLKRREAPKEEVIEIEHDGETLKFVFEPFLSTDVWAALRYIDRREEFHRWILKNKFSKILDETFEDGAEITAANVYELPSTLVLQAAAKYEEYAASRIDGVTEEQKKSEKKTKS